MATRGHWRPRFCAAASPSRSRAGQGPDRAGVGVGGAGAGGLMTQVRQLRPPARGKGRSRGLASCALLPPTSGALAPPAPHHRQKGRGQSPGLNQRTRESWTGLILAQRARLVLINMPGGRRLAGTARALGLCWTGRAVWPSRATARSRGVFRLPGQAQGPRRGAGGRRKPLVKQGSEACASRLPVSLRRFLS